MLRTRCKRGMMESNDQPEWAPAEQPSWNPAEWVAPVASSGEEAPMEDSYPSDTSDPQPYSQPAQWATPTGTASFGDSSNQSAATPEIFSMASEWEIPAPPAPVNQWAAPAAGGVQEWAPVMDSTPSWNPSSTGATEWEPEVPTIDAPEVAIPDGPAFAQRGGDSSWEPPLASDSFAPPTALAPSFAPPTPTGPPEPHWAEPTEVALNASSPADPTNFRPTPPPWEQEAPAAQTADWTPPWGSPSMPGAQSEQTSTSTLPDFAPPAFAAPPTFQGSAPSPNRTQLGGPDGPGPRLSPLPVEPSANTISFDPPQPGAPLTPKDAPSSSRKKKGLIALLVALLITALAATALFTLLKPSSDDSTAADTNASATDGPQQQAETFVAAVIKADVPTAYGLTSTSLRASTSEEKFSEFVKAREESLRGATYSVTSPVGAVASADGSPVVVPMKIVSPLGDLEYPSSVTLVSEGGKWVVSGFQIDDPAASPNSQSATTTPSDVAATPNTEATQTGDTAVAAVDPATQGAVSSVANNGAPENSAPTASDAPAPAITEPPPSSGPTETIAINSGF